MRSRNRLVFPAKSIKHYPKSIGQVDDILEIFKACSKTTKRKDDSNDSDDTSSSEDDDQIGVDGFEEKTTHD